MIYNLWRISFGKIGFYSFLGACFLSAQIHASVSFTISAERLQDPIGTDMAESGVLVLVADTSGDGFQGADPTAFVAADDYLVGMWDIATGGGNTPGALARLFVAICLISCWSSGDDRQATCHKEVMADRNVRPPLTLVPAKPEGVIRFPLQS